MFTGVWGFMYRTKKTDSVMSARMRKRIIRIDDRFIIDSLSLCLFLTFSTQLRRLRLVETRTQTFSKHGEILGSTGYIVARNTKYLHLSFFRFNHFPPLCGEPETVQTCPQRRFRREVRQTLVEGIKKLGDPGT